MAANASDIMIGLASLTRTELEAVRNRCSYLLQHERGGRQVQDDWLLAGILHELRRCGIDNRATYRPRKSSASFVPQSARVRKLLTDAVPDMSTAECLLLGEIAASCLASYIARRYELSLASMLGRVSQVPVAIDSSFPGYLESGMLGMVIRSPPR